MNVEDLGPNLLQEVLVILHDILSHKDVVLSDELKHKISDWRSDAEDYLSGKGFF